MNNCSDHGACDSRTGVCWCDPGWTAGDCSKQLCYNNCTGHGVCFEGLCQCQDGYSGNDCSVFPCLNGCSGHGSCYNGTCACDHLYVGPDCSSYAAYLTECPGNCTGRGTCVNATCHCDPGWSGLDCMTSIDCPGNCSAHGVCYNATCACDLGFSGLDCAAPHCLNNCSLHGACTSNGTCACDPTWHGADCSLPDLTCGVGFDGNCSGHGACIDSAVNQWWSGNSMLPDMWAWEQSSKHLVRRDVAKVGDHILGKCSVDFHGLPTNVENLVSIGYAQGDRVMESNGIPDHFVIHDGYSMCEVTWRVSVPQRPQVMTGPCNYNWPLPGDMTCPQPSPLSRSGPIGYALNGVPIWGALLSDGSNAVEGAEQVPCYGHASRTGMWHYHHPILGCNIAANQETLLGYAIDGFAIYGPLSGSKDEVDDMLDKCNGRALPDGSYRYHVRTLLQVDENLPYQDNSKDPRNPMMEPVHTNWNYVLGCFSGRPFSSLGLRHVTLPLMAESDDWIANHDISALSTDSIADQLGLTARIGLCMCDAGWVGSDCRKMGCLNNCSGNGICEATETDARCSCDPAFRGMDCSELANTTCSTGCSGHGTCLWAASKNATCLCDPEWKGSHCGEMASTSCPYNCSGHGSCINNTCLCDHMYEGRGCETPSSHALNLNATLCWQRIGNIVVNNSCAGRGTCFNGTCICDVGWTGANCTTPAIRDPVYIECPSNCSFHGACSYIFDEFHATFNGTCICDAGYDGPDCSIDWGTHQCDGNCSAHGSCVNKTCICDPGWDGFDCNERWVSPYPLCPLNCSNHGSCFNGTCSCDLGWHGANCSLPMPCPGSCSGHGTCSLGNCTCDPDWAGDDCSHMSYCPGFVSELGVNCSGHGVCIGGNCSCELQWGGFDCSIQGCVNSCSSNGVCRNGTCECAVGFIGEDCSLGPYSGECPGQCSGHGACALIEDIIHPYGISNSPGDASLSGSIACVCDEGWGGASCMIRTCPNDCSGNGACAQNGTCYCYKNWGGDDCSTAWCPNACSNHGTCMGGQGCLCDVGYDGLDCGISSCPNNCTGRGVCLAAPGIEYNEIRPELDAEQGYHAHVNKSSSSCLCFYGWGGQDCSQISCPLNCSFPRGYCNNGTCVCDMEQGYYGRNCSERFGTVSLLTDGNALTPSYGIYEGGTMVTVRGTGFVSSDTMRCKFGSNLAPATIVRPNPPDVPYAWCVSPRVDAAIIDGAFFQFSVDGVEWTLKDSRIKFVYHDEGMVTSVRWPTGPEDGGTVVTFEGENFQFALGVKCKFGTYEVLGSFNSRFIVDRETGEQNKTAELKCAVPALAALDLPASAGSMVRLEVSMNMGQNWMWYRKDFFFKYYGARQISPSFGPRQDQNTEIMFYGFNLFQENRFCDCALFAGQANAGQLCQEECNFPALAYEPACRFDLPWASEPVQVKSLMESWTLMNAPPDAARFGCRAPPGLVGAAGSQYTGTVQVRLSLNPCIYAQDDIYKEFGCVDSLPFTPSQNSMDSVYFYYIENTVNFLSVTLGPTSGGTTVTIKGNQFDKRDLAALPNGNIHKPVLCKWGSERTEGIYHVDDQSVSCVSPICVAASCLSLQLSNCPSCVAPITLEVALNGQDFTDSRVKFSYYQDPRVQGIIPSLGPVLGSTSVTIQALGFHDPCVGCTSRSDCGTCGKLIKCKFQAFDRAEYTDGECVKTSAGVCDPTTIRCFSPPGRILRGNVVSLDPFYVALSVSTNNQQFFPINTADHQPYNVDDDQCTGDRKTGCAFFFKYYEAPLVVNVYPTVMSGNGGGRLTVTGVNFLNENHLRCRYHNIATPSACRSGATGSYAPIAAPGQCVDPELESPIFISQTMIICGTVSLEPLTSTSGVKASSTSVGVSFNGGFGEYDTSWMKDISGDKDDNALQVYWVLEIQPSLGFMTGGTRVTVTGVNLESVGIGGDNSKMRCMFASTIIDSDPNQSPDPVDYSGGKIECTSPPSSQTTGVQDVSFGICLMGSECMYTGKSRQAEASDVFMIEVNHFTRGTIYTYYQAPKISLLSPSQGPNTGSTLISVIGEGLFRSPVLACRFDLGHYSSASTLVSSSLAICKTPPITAGSYNVEISLNGQEFSQGCGSTGTCPFYSYNEPLLTRVMPQAGVNSGRTLLVLTVENPVQCNDQCNIKCKFHAMFPPDQERLAIQGFDLITDATLQGNLVTCYSPTSIPNGGTAMLRTGTPEQPKRGLTHVSISWNGQQFSEIDLSAETQQFRFHDPVETVKAIPAGGPVNNVQRVTVFGNNFVDTVSLKVKFGESEFLCAPGAPGNDCPCAQIQYHCESVFYVSAQEIHINVPSSPFATTKTIQVSNNGKDSEYSVNSAEYQYYAATSACPGDCNGHGTCTVAGCGCDASYSGDDCSVGPQVIRLNPSVGLATGGFQVTVIGRNIWAPGTADNTFKAKLDNTAIVEASKATGCTPEGDCGDKLVLTVPTPSDGVGPMREAPEGVFVEITICANPPVKCYGYTSNQRRLQLYATPSISSIVPNGAHYTGNVRVTVSGSNFIDTGSIHIRLGPADSSAPCYSERCMRATFVSTDTIVFKSLPCAGNCSFGAPLLFRFAPNGVDFYETQKTFRFLENTTMTRLSPRVGATTGGTSVEIEATNMNATTGFSCKFGDQVVLGNVHEEIDRGKLICNSPPSVRGNITVPVAIALDGQNYGATPNCTYEDHLCFVYVNPLVASRVYPTLGPVAGGTKITIEGTGFYAVEGVQGLCWFMNSNNSAALTTNMTFVDENHFTCLSPAVSFVSPITKETYRFRFAANGIDLEAGDQEFLFYNHPVLVAPAGDTILPVGSSVLGGTSITISGSGFIDSADGIRFRWEDFVTGNIFISAKATFVSENEIVVITTAYPYDLGNRIKADSELSVSMNDGIDFSQPAADPFAWYRVPTLNEILPPLGPRLGETATSLLGDGFVELRGVAKCRFGDVVTQAVYSDINIAGAPTAPMFQCKSPPWPVPDWVSVEIAMDGQVFTNAKSVKFQYYGEFDVTFATPTGGPKAGGTEVTITGVGFFMSGTYLSCFFGDGNIQCSEDVLYSVESPCYKSVPAAFKTPTQVTCTAPSMPTGGDVTLKYPIRVGLNGQFSQSCPSEKTSYQCALKSGLAFTYYDDVFVTGLSPNSGQVFGGTELTVYGSNFRTDLASSTRCLFTRCTVNDIYVMGDNFGQFKDPNSQTCTGTRVESPSNPGDVGVISSTMIRCLAPAASTADTHYALLDISLNKGITNQNLYGPICRDGSCPVLYFGYALPQLSFNVPSIAPTEGGTIVTVIGAGFIGQQNTNIRCKFGDIDGTNVKFVSDSSILCTAPKQAASTLRIRVSLNGLVTDFTEPDLGSLFMYYDQPELLGAPEPSAGPTSGGTIITIKGTGFVDGGLKCAFFTSNMLRTQWKIKDAEFISSSSASCIAPAWEQSQLVSISLSLNGQDYAPRQLVDSFYYFPAPQVTALVPSAGPAQSGGYVFVQGENFVSTNSLKCRVGVVETTAQFINNSFVRCLTPQIQPKLYSAKVLAMRVVAPEVLPETFTSYPIQGYPLELSFDGQTFSTNKRQYVYYQTPQADLIAPSVGPKTSLSTVAVLTGANFRNDFGGPFCRYGGVGTVKAVFMSDRTIRCQVPSLDLGRTVLIELSINGQEFEDHTSAPYSFMGSAPTIQSADLTDNFDRIQINFDSNTNKGSQVGTFPCRNILAVRKEELLLGTSGLDSSQVQALGIEPSTEDILKAIFGIPIGNFVACRFENNQTASILLGAYPKFGIGHPITLKEDLFMRGSELTYFASGNTTISSPSAPRKPLALLMANDEIGVCGNLEIDASSSDGGLGRSLYFSWVLDQIKSRIEDDNLIAEQKKEFMDSLAEIVASFSGPAFDAEGKTCRNSACHVPAKNGTAEFWKDCFCNKLSVPFGHPNNYPVGRYTVMLTVSNWIGGVSDEASITVEKKLTNIPSVSINMFSGANARVLFVNQSNVIEGSATASSCVQSASTLSFKWTILVCDQNGCEPPAPPGTVLDLAASVVLQARTLVLPAFSLSPGKLYLAKLEVTQSAAGIDNIGSDKVELRTAMSDPRARIQGSERTVYSATDLILDGTGSFHPDFPGISQPSLSYSWTCKESTTSQESSCSNSQGIAFGSGSESTLKIPANSFRPGNAIYVFVLVVSYQTSESSTSIRIHPVEEEIPLVTIEMQDEKRRYPPNMKISLDSSVQAVVSNVSTVTYEWTTLNGDVDVSKPQFLLTSTSRGSSLVVKPNVLTPGQTYTIRLTLTQDGKVGFDQVSFLVDSPPSGGVFELSPISGTTFETIFKFSALGWQSSADSLPILYAFEYTQQGADVFRIIQSLSESGTVHKTLPPGPGTQENTWAIRLRITNSLGSETVMTSCNPDAGGSNCLVKVMPLTYASTDSMLADVAARVSIAQAHIAGGNPIAAIDYITILLMTVNHMTVASRRRSLLGHGSSADLNCGTLAPLLFSSIPTSGLQGHPFAASVSRNVVAALLQLFDVQDNVNDNCMTEMKKIFDAVMKYVASNSDTVWKTEPDLILLQDMTNLIPLALNAVKHLQEEGSLDNSTTAARVTMIISQNEAITAVRSYGFMPGEASKSLDSTITQSKIWKLKSPTSVAQVRGWHRDHRYEADAAVTKMLGNDDTVRKRQSVHAVGHPARRELTAGTTRIPAWAGSFIQSVFALDATTLPFAISKVADYVASNGQTISEEASVSAVATHYRNFYNPYFFSPDSSNVIAPVLSLQLRVFGRYQEVVPLTKLGSPVSLDFQLSSVPSATRDSKGRHRVPACALWDGANASWVFEGCSQPAKLKPSDAGGQNMRALCECTTIGQHTVIDLPAGCDGVAFSSQIYDICGTCGGDGTSCKGCDGIPNSGAKYDGCKTPENPKGVCGGDNSTCTGCAAAIPACDGIPNSGKQIDLCGICGGDNSFCTGCDNVAVHPKVTARMGLRPKAYDRCKSAANPLGVCGGCDASCRGCDRKVNSGKTYDKCGKCGDFDNELAAALSGVGKDDWYSRANKDQNCTLGLKACVPSYYVQDQCGVCVPLAQANKGTTCKGCDDEAGSTGVFTYQNGQKQVGGKTLDKCGVCGGNDCSCIDCKGVVGGPAKYDRCGVCEGNNTCLDCCGEPYGVKVLDVCGICGGTNDTKNCRGCDGNLYPLPLKAPQFDAHFTCCLPSEIGCNDTCYAKLGCDGVCSINATLTDKCGFCGGSDTPNTGICDCAGVPNGPARIGCDGKCRSPALAFDICGVCGGQNESETGHCDCEGIPHGPAIRDSSGVCCYLSDMGCGSTLSVQSGSNHSRCFSGKTWDICNTCGGDGGTCVETRPSSSSRLLEARSLQMIFVIAILLARTMSRTPA